MSNLFGSLDEARTKIAELVEKYSENREQYRSSTYNEETARSEFVSPFFEALGWDVSNRQALAPAYKDVIHEEGIKVGDFTKAPDYTFRVGGQRKFFVEAKRPSVDIKSAPGPAYQLRRYAWSAKLPLSIVTDFEELAVYDTRKRPAEGDKPSVARIQLHSFDDYVPKLEEIWNVFSKGAVYKGSFDRYAEETLGKRGTSEVDAEFLKELERWRDELARNIALRNADLDLDVDGLNFAVQATIDRVLFLRIAEGRGVEPYQQLGVLTSGERTYPRLMQLFHKADAKYNSGLFDFKTDRLTPQLDIDDKVLCGILGNLYYPQSPYEFSVLPPEILGNVYEQFLGKVIRLTASGRAKVEEKPAVKKAGGVYYTPTYIVDYIVKHTVGRLCQGQSPKKMSTLRVLDPACGSGSFLLAAFQTLMAAHLDWYRGHSPTKHKSEVFIGPGGEWRLTTAEKRRILLNSIFGVDIDRQAVEVTKLSLLLRVLEGENAETLHQHQLFGERALPSLEANIKCGNSLIGPDAFRGVLFSDPDDLRRINAFDWSREFSEVFRAGGFDAVIGNPPYIRIQTMKEWAPFEVELYKNLYDAARSGNYDIYVVVVEKALSLLNERGRLGFILPHKFFNAQYGEGLRQIISRGRYLSEVVHFGDQQVFKGATTYTCLLFLDKAGRDSVVVENVSNLSDWRESGSSDAGVVAAEKIGGSEWNFSTGEGTALAERLAGMSGRLGEIADIFVGVQTSADDVFILDLVEAGSRVLRLRSRALEEEVALERGLVHPLVSGPDVERYAPLPNRQYVIFPYVLDSDTVRLLTLAELREQFPKTASYLMRNKARLESRERGKLRGDNWHGYIYLKNMRRQFLPKICVPRLVLGLSASLDSEGSRVLDNVDVGGITLKSAYSQLDPRYLLALLNSRVLRWYFPHVSAPFRGGYRSANKQFLSQLPIRTLDFSKSTERRAHEALVSLAERMLDLYRRRQGAKTGPDRTLLSRQIETTDREIDQIAYELYEISPTEITMIEKTVSQT